MKCEKCGSQFVDEKKYDNTETITIYFQCRSCGHSIEKVIEKDKPTGKWLMTLYEPYIGICGDHVGRAEIYIKDDGTFEIKQYYKKITDFCLTYTLLKMRPKVYARKHLTLDGYVIEYNSRKPNDDNGTDFKIARIELNSMLTKDALTNDAMRAIHIKDKIFEPRSPIDDQELMRGVSSWINSILGPVPQSKTGCYVATCVYGSYDCPQVWTLRRYRDETLASTWYGRVFINTYYAISPTLVKRFGNTKWFKKMWQGKLDRMVKKLNAKGIEDTPYEDKNWR